MSTLRETFFEELAEINDAEHQLLAALPKLTKAAHHEQLRRDFQEHLEEMEEQVNRLGQVFEVLGETAERSPCQPMLALLTAAAEHIERESGDAALICAAQKVAHYEMAAFGALQSWARLLGEEEAADLLEQVLDEKESADDRLAETAESILTVQEERSG